MAEMPNEEPPVEEWVEPFRHLMEGRTGSPGYRHMSPYLIASAYQNCVLSERAIIGVHDLILSGPHWGDDSNDWLQSGKTQTLLEVSLAMLEQSYFLAHEKYHQRQLATTALTVLFAMESQSPLSVAAETISRIARRDDSSCSRVLLLQENFLLDTLLTRLGRLVMRRDIFAQHVLADLKYFVQHKLHHDLERHIASVLKCGLLSYSAESSEALDCLYIIVEHYATGRRYERVLRIKEWLASGSEALTAEAVELDHRIQLCFARACEARGLFEEASKHYQKSGHHEKATLLETKFNGEPYWTQASETLQLTEDFSLCASRELPGGHIGIFLKNVSRTPLTPNIQFFEVSLGGTASFDRKELPAESKSWQSVQVVPGTAEDRILWLLVAPINPNAVGMDLFSDLLGSSKDITPAEVWKFEDSKWTQIRTRGDIPNRRVIARMGNYCSFLRGKKIVVFGGNTLMEQDESSTCFVLDLESREWMRVPHPYGQCFMIDSNGAPTGPIRRTLPPFTLVAPAPEKDKVLILRKGPSEVNAKAKKELVSKFSLDMFGQQEAQDTQRPDYWWWRDIPTADESAYIANYMHSKAVTISGSLVVFGYGQDSMILRKSDSKPGQKMKWVEGPRAAMRKPTLDILDLKDMAWRSSTKCHNSWVLGSDIKEAQITYNAQNDCCYFCVLQPDMKLRLMCLHNASSLIPTEATASKRKANKNARLSRKNSIAYQLDKAQREFVRPRRVCASCGMFESNITFKCCSQCRVPYYCTKECQRKHWAKNGGNHRTHCKPPPSEDISIID